MRRAASARRAVHLTRPVSIQRVGLACASRRRTWRARGPGRAARVRGALRTPPGARGEDAVAERERHPAFAHDPPSTRATPRRLPILLRRRTHGALEQDGVAGHDRPAVAHAVDAHEVDEARAVLGLGEDEHGAGLGHGLGEDRGRQHRAAARAGDEVALVGGDVLDPERRAGPPPARGCGPRAGTDSGGAGCALMSSISRGSLNAAMLVIGMRRSVLRPAAGAACYHRPASWRCRTRSPVRRPASSWPSCCPSWARSTPSSTPTSCCRAIARQLRRIVDYKILDIFLPEPDGTLVPAFVEGYDAELAAQLPHPARARASSGTAAARRETVFVPDVAQDPRYIALFPGVVAELAIPLLHRDRLVGVLNVEGPDPHAFTPEARTAPARCWPSHLAVGDRERHPLPRDAAGTRACWPRSTRSARRPPRSSTSTQLLHARGRGREARDRLRDVRHPAPGRGGAASWCCARRSATAPTKEKTPHQLGEGLCRRRRAGTQAADPGGRRARGPALPAPHPETRSELVVPLVHKDRVVGVFDLESPPSTASPRSTSRS